VYSPRHIDRIAYACDPGDASSAIRLANPTRDRRTSSTYSVLGIGGISESIGGPINLTPSSLAGYQLRIQSRLASTTWKEGLTWADDGDGGGFCAAVRQTFGGDVDDLDAVIPIGSRLGEVLVHLTQASGQLLVRGVSEHGDQINVADAGLEVASDQGPEEIQTDQRRPCHGQDRIPDGIQHRGNSGIERGGIRAHAATVGALLRSLPVADPDGRIRYESVRACSLPGRAVRIPVMFNIGDRDRVRDRVLDLASTDSRVVAGAAVGSLAHEQGDQWSDLDLMFAVANEVPPTTVLEDWTQTLVWELDAVPLFDLPSGPIIYRVFLFPDSLELDLSFTPASEFSAGGPTFRLLFGEAHEQANEPPTPAQELLGHGVHHALHARVAIERGRDWQAEYWISAVRDKALHLACRRHGLDGWYGRDFDKLPPEVLDRINVARALAPTGRASTRPG
jgi:hypothetical protein